MNASILTFHYQSLYQGLCLHFAVSHHDFSILPIDIQAKIFNNIQKNRIDSIGLLLNFQYNPHHSVAQCTTRRDMGFVPQKFYSF